MVSAAGVGLTRLSALRPAERFVAAYALLAAVIATLRISRYTPTAWAAAAHLLLIALLFLAAHAAPQSDDSSSRRWTAVLRDALPLLALVGLYTLLDVVNLAGAVPTWDAPVQRLEYAIFGLQPSRDWWRLAPSTFWSTVLHAAYFAYYALIAVPALLLLARGDRPALAHFTERVIITFMLCYAVFVLFPVAGPYYEFPQPSGEFVANLPARLVYGSLENGSSFGAAFPSSHVAATLAATGATLRTAPRLGRLMILPAILLTVATVYCQMHYALDAIAGVVLGVAVAAWPTTPPPRA